ncbi:MAG: putative b-glycosidase, glycoside hydrolase family 8 protein [Bacteroidota bacterium]|jgi:hypothetical protein
MRTIIIFTCCLLVSCAVYSQNWRLFHPSREAYYGSELYLGTTVFTMDYALRIDSFEISGNDTVWFPSREHAPDVTWNDSCWLFQPIPGAFGESIRQKPNGDYNVLYPHGDTAHWKMNATAPWRLLNNTTGGIPARIDAIPLGKSIGTTPFGTIDSLYTLELRYYYSNGALCCSTLCQISKTEGLTSIPFIPERFPFQGVVDYTWDTTVNLVSIANPAIGLQNIPRGRFFSMQVGDTIQIEEYFYDDGPETQFWSWRQDIYLDRWQSTLGDTIFFHIDRSEFFQTLGQPTPPPSRRLLYDTIPINSSLYQRLDRDLGEVWPADEDASSWSYQWRKDSTFPDRLMKPLHVLEPFDSLRNCHYKVLVGGSFYDEWRKFYMDGLGGPYYSEYDQGWYQAYRKPIYCHVGAVVQGTPIDFLAATAIEQAVADPVWQIFPNPAQSEINLDLRAWTDLGQLEVKVLALNGQVVQHASVEAGMINRLSVAELPRGIYFLRFETAKGTLVKKVVVQ